MITVYTHANVGLLCLPTNFSNFSLFNIKQEQSIYNETLLETLNASIFSTTYHSEIGVLTKIINQRTYRIQKDKQNLGMSSESI